MAPVAAHLRVQHNTRLHDRHKTQDSVSRVGRHALRDERHAPAWNFEWAASPTHLPPDGAENFKPNAADLRGRTSAVPCVRVLPRIRTPAAGQRSVVRATHHRASAAGEHQRDEDLCHRPARKLDLRRVRDTSLRNRSGRGGGLLFLNKIQLIANPAKPFPRLTELTVTSLLRP